MKIVVIPARGGSKGIPRKNLSKVHGVSLVERSIRAAKGSTADVIILSTDDHEIAEIGRKYNLTIHNRSLENSSDYATTESVIGEVVAEFSANWHVNSTIAFIQATSPFLKSTVIDECLEIAEAGFSAFTAIESHAFRWTRNSEGIWMPAGHPNDFRPRRQDLKPEVVETGGCYAFPLYKFQINPYRFCATPSPVLISWQEGIDIDDQSDLKLANSLNAVYGLADNINREIGKPKVVVTDFDGCLTNDRVILSESGIESITANRKDGLAAKRLHAHGIRVLILSSEENQVVTRRAAKMGVEVIQGSKDKLSSLQIFLDENSLQSHDVWYVGNDLNDFDVMQSVGLSLCPGDAVELIRLSSDVVLIKKGGEGILEEIVSYLEDKWP